LKLAAALTAALGLQTSALAADIGAPQWREDAVAAFDSVLCAGTSGDLTVAAQKHGVYDGQIEGAKLSSRDGRPLDLDAAKMRARSIARVKRYTGYAAGQCADGSAWAAAFPAPTTIKFENQSIKLPISALQKQCSDWSVDLATSSAVERLPASATIKVAKEKSGMMSVTCQPRRPRWQGPVVWYLIPVGQGPGGQVPHADMLSLNSGAPASIVATRLRSWVNAVRGDAKLAPVTVHSHLDAEAELLAIDTSVAHDRLLLKRIANGLPAHDLRLIGEDRARAADLQRVAWLLWNSPRHRALLLDPDATHSGIAIKDVRGEMLAVILAAGGPKATTAKGPTKKILR
jgi:hypothetical protein